MRKVLGATLAALLAVSAACVALAAETAADRHLPRTHFLSPHGQDVETFQLAGNPRGDAAAAWIEFGHRGRSRLWLRTRRHGERFGLPAVVTGRVVSSESPRVAVSHDGSVIVGWVELRRPRPRMVVLMRRGYGRFAKRVVSPRAGRDAELAVALAPDGTAMAAWTDGPRHGAQQLHAAVRPPGGRWSTGHTVTHGKWSVASPRIAFDATGDATLAWERRRPRRGGGDDLFIGVPASQVAVSERPAGGPFGRPHVVSRRGPDASQPVLAENGRGDAVVAWDSVADGFKSFRIGYVTRPAGKRFGRARWLTPRDGFAAFPRPAVDAEGRIDVAWTQGSKRHGHPCGGCFAARIAHGQPGGALTHRRRVSERRGNLDALAAEPGGDKLLVWDVQTTSPVRNRVEGRFATRAGGLGRRRRLSRIAINEDVQAVLGSNGHGLVAWIVERRTSRIVFVHVR
jgi:hypothetical protein